MPIDVARVTKRLWWAQMFIAALFTSVIGFVVFVSWTYPDALDTSTELFLMIVSESLMVIGTFVLESKKIEAVTEEANKRLDEAKDYGFVIV